MFSIAAVLMCGLVAGITVPLIQSDLRSRLLPNDIVLPGYFAIVVLSAAEWVRTGDAPLAILGSGAIWFGLFCLAALTGGLGMGDVKLGGLLGAGLGLISWQSAAAGLVLVGLGSGIAGAAVLLRRMLGPGRALAPASTAPNIQRRSRQGHAQPLVPADPNGYDPAASGIPLGPILLGGYWATVAGTAGLLVAGWMPS